MTKKESMKGEVEAVAGTGSSWSLLGSTEVRASAKVEATRRATGILSQWSGRLMQKAADESCCVSFVLVEGDAAEPVLPARKVNGVERALSPEYNAAFGPLTADFIKVEEGLRAHRTVDPEVTK